MLVHCAMTWTLLANFAPQKSGFPPGAVNEGFVMDKVALRKVFLQILKFCLVHIHQVSSGGVDIGLVSGICDICDIAHEIG